MKRNLLLAIGAIGLAGSCGLFVYGSSFVAVFHQTLTFRVVDPPQPPPASLDELTRAVGSGVALAIGLAGTCCVLSLLQRERGITPLGKVLYVIAGLLLVVGVAPLAWALMQTYSAFQAVAMAESMPTPDDLLDMQRAASGPLTTGYSLLVAGSLLGLAAAAIGGGAQPPETPLRRSPVNLMVAGGSLFVGVILILLLGMIGMNGQGLQRMLGGGPLPKPAELAMHLSGILTKSLIVFIGIGTLAILQIASAVGLPAVRKEGSAADPGPRIQVGG